jgi:hypothetical protein
MIGDSGEAVYVSTMPKGSFVKAEDSLESVHVYSGLLLPLFIKKSINYGEDIIKIYIYI